MELGIKYQWLLIPQKERKPDILCFLMEDHNAIYEKVLSQKGGGGLETKSDHISRSKYQFIGNTEDRGSCQTSPWRCYQQNPDYGKH